MSGDISLLFLLLVLTGGITSLVVTLLVAAWLMGGYKR